MVNSSIKLCDPVSNVQQTALGESQCYVGYVIGLQTGDRLVSMPEATGEATWGNAMFRAPPRGGTQSRIGSRQPRS